MSLLSDHESALLPGPSAQDGWLNMVTFSLSGQTYALPIEPIRQIIEMVTITPMPQVSESIRGVINFHGAAVPVIDMRRHMGLSDQSLGQHTPIILAEVGKRLMGLVVDDVQDVLNRPQEDLIRPHDILPEGHGELTLLRGMIQLPEKLVMVLDLDQLFAPQQVRLLVKAAQALQENAAQENLAELKESEQSEELNA